MLLSPTILSNLVELGKWMQSYLGGWRTMQIDVQQDGTTSGNQTKDEEIKELEGTQIFLL